MKKVDVGVYLKQAIKKYGLTKYSARREEKEVSYYWHYWTVCNCWYYFYLHKKYWFPINKQPK